MTGKGHAEVEESCMNHQQYDSSTRNRFLLFLFLRMLWDNPENSFFLENLDKHFPMSP